MPSSDHAAIAGLAAAAVTAIAALAAVRLVRGSTAVPAALWGAAAALALACEFAARLAGGPADLPARAAARLATAALAVCPAMAILGAKRPQHGVWQFIVATLGVVCVLPAASALLVRPGALPDVPLLLRVFLLALVLVGWMNFVGTRHGAAATLVTLGQGILLRPLLPFASMEDSLAATGVDAAAAWLVAVGGAASAVQSAIAGRRRAETTLARRIEQPFLALRETLGAAWTLRIAERFNATAESRGWPCRLGFRGLEPPPGQDQADWHRDAVRSFEALARRFVDAGWLRRHSRG